ncbi:hypothetical protein FB45DRAFT_841586 [Roridomyces roridus]|uniref:CxC2-like cysteine cluster KDZ transposase-associated domain-containing protein n=1 Tax=Roridomyces roridus TaxID=1738132 RepID=A0AAD7FCK3_9AGAR|nr:hypothetical protein FB45DRAFT_841586 [Roridomyces roridus]
MFQLGKRTKQKKRAEADVVEHVDPDLVEHRITTDAGTSSHTVYIPSANPGVVLKKLEEKAESPPEGSTPTRPSQNSEVLQQFKKMKPFLLKSILDREASPVFGTVCECGNGLCEVTCHNCTQYRPSCKPCFIQRHRTCPFHWVEEWDAEKGFLERRDISALGHAITFGHYGSDCCVTSPEDAKTMIIVDVTGIHTTSVIFCRHDHAFSKHNPDDRSASWDQVGLLLDAGLFPCSYANPRTAITFECLKMFEMLSMEGKLSNYDFAVSLRRLSNNSFTEDVSDVEENLIRTARLWGVLTLAKRLGQEHGIDEFFPFRPNDNLVLYCPTCPEPGFNMDPKIGSLPSELRHLVQQRDTLDGNFHCNKAKKNTDPNDVSLFAGKAYFPSSDVLREYLGRHRGKTDEPTSTCNHLKAVKNQNKKKFKNMEITGVVNVQCSHVFVKVSVDLQFGERFCSVDFALAHALDQKLAAGYTGDVTFKIHVGSVDHILSYDSMCQYSVHIIDRFKADPNLQHLVPIVKQMRFAIPALHVQGHQDGCMYVYATVYMQATAHFHGETAEQYWPELNQLGPQVRQMNGGHRQDTIIKHHSDWNYKKLAKAVTLLVRELETGDELFKRHRTVFLGLSASYADRIDKEGWRTLDRTPDYNNMKDVKSVYRMKASKVPTQSTIYKKMLSDEAQHAAAQSAISLDKSKVAFVLNEGLKIQALQREIRAAIKANAAHELLSTQKTITEMRVKASARIAKLRKVQVLVVPEVLEELGKREASDVETVILGLPSDFTDTSERVKLGLNALVAVETQLREGQAFDAMKQVKAIAASISALQINGQKNSGGITRNSISLEGIQTTKALLNKWIGEYNSARKAMMVLGHSTGGQDFPELKEADTYRKPTGRRQLGDSRRVDGGAWAIRRGKSGATVASSSGARVAVEGTASTRAKSGSSRAPATQAEQKNGWIWEGKLGKMTAQELDEWSREANRVQWFRAEAEMMRQLELVEAKLAEIRTTIRSFEAYHDVWTKIAGAQEEANPKHAGHIAYAKQKAWMFGQRAARGRERLRLTNYPSLAEEDADLVGFVSARRKEYEEELAGILKEERARRAESTGDEDGWMDVDDDEELQTGFVPLI